MQRYRKLTTICCAAVLSLGLAACGGGDSTPVTETDEYMDLKQMADQYKAKVMELEGTIGSAGDAADPNGSLHAQINHHSGEAARLSGMIGDAGDAGDANGSLHAQINFHSGEVTRLNGMIGDAGDAGDANGSLHAQINFHSGEVTRLEGVIGDAGDAADANGSLHAQINFHSGEADRLGGRVTSLETMIGEEDDAPDMNGSLYAQINYWKAEAESLRGGTHPGQLGPIKTAATTASNNAGTARDDADGFAGEAETASENRATIQTEDEDGNPNSVTDAAKARMYANTAKEEAKKASDAAQKAQDADNVDDATKYRNMAQEAERAADDAKMKAETARDDAVADAKLELKIDDKTKSVGDTSITVGVGKTVRTENGVASDTGTLGHATGSWGPTAGVAWVANTDPTADVEYVQAVAMHTVNIGTYVDSDDDSARLRLVHSYVGTQSVNVYTWDTGAASGPLSGQAGTPTASDLTSLGMHYLAENDTGTASALEETDEVQAPATPPTNGAIAEVVTYDNEGTPVYLVKTGTADGVDQYRVVDVDVVQSDDTTDGTDDAASRPVKATIPVATEYSHIHFGLWNALAANTATKGGPNQEIADLGKAFVHNFSGGGMTEVMPNNGTGTFSGNWVASVQAADNDGDGAITHVAGDATLTADFGKGTVEAMLTNLATLEGTIDGSEFSGSKLTSLGSSAPSTDATKFTGDFNGAFFGSKAAEAGGIFDYSSDGNKQGAFRGAFGGRQ